MSKYIVAERNPGSAWQQVRYNNAMVKQFDSEADAVKSARDYVTAANVDNALASDQKGYAAEVYLMDNVGAFLGVLDGKDWYQKDSKGKPVTKTDDYWLSGKSEIAVRKVPGT